MKKGLLLFLFASLACIPAFSQVMPHVCGNAEDQSDLIPRLRENKLVMEAMRAAAADRSEVRYVPIHFHLVGDADGNGKHKEIRILEQLCALNAAYEPVGIQFYLSEHPTYGLFNKSINNNNVFDNQSNTLLMNLRRHNNAINVFVVETPVSGNNQPGITLAYYNIPQDWIVSRKTEINGAMPNSTLPHEMGHLFTLPHTFFGYENNPFDAADPTWPVAPVNAPLGNGITTERQNGTNCTTSADEICDTPPDYNFGFISNNCNNYSGGAKDPLGTLVDPMENNYMSYFLSCSSYQFTQDQIDIMNADLSSSARNYLDNSFSPVATSINTPTDLLVGPAHAGTVPYYNEVLLEWQPVAGATHYLVDIDIVSTFGTQFAQTFIETGTSKLLTNLSPNKTYYWRVKPFNHLVGCAAFRSRNLKTPATATTGTIEIEGLNAWQIAPNPAQDAQVNLLVNANDAFEASVRVTDAAGKTVAFHQGVNFQQGENTFALDINGLANGLYLVSLESQNGRNVRKLSVLR
ncbi:MAG TPA: T9SS type A sorting domain-containing protein [Saprospiraceae bacterium]|nr:T9SS type A sorting domain-containing protein [Saprospiraceae bacterium]